MKTSEKTAGVNVPKPKFSWDAFICHASEDKEPFVSALATALSKEFRIWYDEFTLTVGDRLRRKIDEGLAKSRYGVVVLSEHFFEKHWPQQELDGLANREVGGHKVILPVWLNVSYEDVCEYSPTLADRLAAKAADGLEVVVRDLTVALRQNQPARIADHAQQREPRPTDQITGKSRFAAFPERSPKFNVGGISQRAGREQAAGY